MPNSKIPKIISWSVATAMLALLPVTFFFIGYYNVPQNGMYPGLPAGSIFFVTKRPYASVSDVKRGDIVVFVREEQGKRYNYIWRVVALPGDTVHAADESLTINGQDVQRQPAREMDDMKIYREQIGEISYEVAFDSTPKPHPPDTDLTVPPDHLFVVGDNRFHAKDSRYFGPIPFSSIIGKKL